jgi:hypothetical protein
MDPVVYFRIARIRRVVLAFAVMYGLSAGLSLLNESHAVAGLLGAAFLALLQLILGWATARAPLFAMVGTTVIFSLIELMALLSDPMALISLFSALGVALTVHGMREALSFRKSQQDPES